MSPQWPLCEWELLVVATPQLAVTDLAFLPSCPRLQPHPMRCVKSQTYFVSVYKWPVLTPNVCLLVLNSAHSPPLVRLALNRESLLSLGMKEGALDSKNLKLWHLQASVSLSAKWSGKAHSPQVSWVLNRLFIIPLALFLVVIRYYNMQT